MLWAGHPDHIEAIGPPGDREGTPAEAPAFASLAGARVPVEVTHQDHQLIRALRLNCAPGDALEQRGGAAAALLESVPLVVALDRKSVV